MPTIENNRVVACCPQCGHEDREDAPDNLTQIHRHSGTAWCKERMRDLLENPAYHEYVMRAVIAKERRLFNEYWGRLKISVMSCTACGRREETLAAADLDEYAPSGDEPWWTTHNLEILLLRRWQVPESRMARFDRENSR